MRNFKIAFLAGAMALAGTIGVANATPLGGTFNISVYQGPGNGNIGNANNQAQQSNPLIAPGNLIGFGTYTGVLDLDDGGTNTIGAFLSSAGGTVSAGLAAISGSMLSTANFGMTSVFVITGNVGGSVLGGTISHDDGASLYDGAGFGVLVAGSPSPTVEIPTPFAGLTGAFQLIYVEANSIPAVLTLDVTSNTGAPEPLTLSLFGAGLAGLGAMRRRKVK